MIIYLLRNKVNGKGYVGQTRRTLEERWKEHAKPSQRKDGLALHNAIRKHGREAFERQVLNTALNLDALNLLERFWIKELRTLRPGGYNLTNGGDGGFMRSVETRRRMSLAQIGNQKSKGFKHSAESRAKMSEAQRGNQKAKGWKNLLGYHHTPETKARISSALKGRKKRARRSSSL